MGIIVCNDPSLDADPPRSAIAADALPAPIAASLARHRRHLADLVASMRAIGVPDDVVRESVHTIVGSYEDELVAALLALKGGELRA